MTPRTLDAQTDFGRGLRANLAPVIDTTKASPQQVAVSVAAWVRSHLQP